MRVAFKDIGDPAASSSRIFGYYLASLLEAQGHEVRVNQHLVGTEDVILVGKGSNRAPIYRLRSPNSVIGLINPSLRSTKVPRADFFLVGSIEEAESLAFTRKPRVLFPLIEPGIISRKKKYSERQPIVVYHGNAEHLRQLSKSCRDGIEAAHARVSFSLRLVYDWERLGRVNLGLPPRIEVEYVQWEQSTFMRRIRESSVGIAPAGAPEEVRGAIQARLSHTLRAGHHILATKRLNNIGRALLMSQLGVPVIAELSPSALALYSDPKRGFVCASAAAWEEALVTLLTSEDKRKDVSQRAFEYVTREFDPDFWAASVADDLSQLCQRA